MKNLINSYDINDYFTVKYCDLYFCLRFSQNSLFSLYQPIIGTTAISLYLTLNSINSIYEKSIFTYKDILILLQIDKQKLTDSFKKLELLKLIQTHKALLKTNEPIIIYKLNNPLNVEEFLNDKELEKIITKHLDGNYLRMIIDKYNKLLYISHSIKSNTIKNYNTKMYSTTIEKTKHSNTINNEKFNYFNFYELISNVFSEIKILDDNRDYIIQKSNLYSLSTYDMIDIFSQIKKVNNKEEFINKFNSSLNRYLNKKNKYNIINKSTNNSKSDFKKMKSSISIRQIKETSPQKYIKYITGSLTPADIKNINILSEQYYLTPEVINCLYNFVVFKYNTVNFNLIEKIANTWNKEKINSFEDAIDFLRKQDHKKKKKNIKILRKNKSNFKNTFKEEELLKQITKI